MSENRDADEPGLEIVPPAELAPVVDDLRRAYLVPVHSAVSRRHLDAMASAMRPPRSRRLKRAALGAGVFAGVVLATGGLAAAGVLPDTIQHAVSTMADPFGVHLPDGSSFRPSTPDSSGQRTGSDGGGGKPDAPTSTETVVGSPGAAEKAPGGTGPADDAPGHGGENPGNAENAPGQQNDPGRSDDAPGHGGVNPGQSADAPGQGGQNPGNSGNTPATSGNNGGGNDGNAKEKDKQDGHGNPPTTPRPTTSTMHPTTTTPAPPTTPKATEHKGGGNNKD